MRRDLAFLGAARHVERPIRSIACVVFVALLSVAFWAGAVWIARTFLWLNSSGVR